MTVRSVFTAPEVVQLINDLDYSRLDYWARTKVLMPSVMVSKGRGSRRLYSFTDVIILRVLTKLRSEGVGQDRLRNISNFLKKNQSTLENASVETRFLTDGRNLCKFEYTMEGILSVQDNSDLDSIVWVIPVGLMVEALKTQVDKLLEDENAQDVG